MNNAASSSPRTGFVRPGAETRLRLFCFPYAGAGASVFREWAKALPSEIEVIPVQLPGRESRIREPLLTRVGTMVEMLLGEITNLHTPFAFFGHSMGALVCFELARRLRDGGKPSPVHLFVSARRAPQTPDEKPPLHKLEDRDLLEELRQFNATPAEIFQYPALIGFWVQ